MCAYVGGFVSIDNSIAACSVLENDPQFVQ
jgi:hypothetical protein